MLLTEYLNQWLSVFVEPFRAPNTVAAYRRAIDALPAKLMQTQLDQVTGLQLQAAINTKARQHPRAAQLIYAMLHVALGKASTCPGGLGLISVNPAAACIKPKHKPAKAAVLTADQLRQYLQAARSEVAFPLLLLMAVCGLRRSEALGLTWAAIDLQAATITINQQRLRMHHGYNPAPLKSDAAYRVLEINADLVEILKPFRGFPRAWVVDITPEALAKAHYRCIEAIGAPHVTLHGLRHSMATLAAGQGVPLKSLQVTLGHASFSLTANLYANHHQKEATNPVISTVSASII